jgi:hypothetical protein
MSRTIAGMLEIGLVKSSTTTRPSASVKTPNGSGRETRAVSSLTGWPA